MYEFSKQEKSNKNKSETERSHNRQSVEAKQSFKF